MQVMKKIMKILQEQVLRQLGNKPNIAQQLPNQLRLWKPVETPKADSKPVEPATPTIKPVEKQIEDREDRNHLEVLLFYFFK